MKTFFLIAILIYLSINTYIFIRGWQATPPVFTYRLVYTVLFILIFPMFFYTVAGMNVLPLSVLRITYAIGTTWLACMVYFLLFLLITDIAGLLNHRIHFLPANITACFRQIQFFGISAVIVIMLIYGYYNFSHPAVNTYDIAINKKVEKIKDLRVVELSDIHLGLLINKNRLREYVDKINALSPDIILIAGDVIDNSTRPLNLEHMEEELNRLNAPLGVYMCLGNHEYLSGINKSKDFLAKTKINLLIDSVAHVENSFWIVGRNDKIVGDSRLPLSDLIAQTNREEPIFLLDHQPYYLDDAEKNGVDFQLSGHTHNGQLWPGNYIVNKIFEVGHGYKRKGNLHVYVSSGLALWGPLFRIGTKSEIAVFNIKFD